MKPFYATLSVILALLTLLALPVIADVGHVGIGISQSAGEGVAASLQGEFETETYEIEVSAQGIEYYDIKISPTLHHPFLLFNVPVAISVFSEHDLTGFTLSKLNMKNDIGIAGTGSLGDLDVELSAFYRLGNVSGTTYLLHKGNRVQQDGEDVILKAGLTPVAGGYPNIALATIVDVLSWELELKGLTNLAESPTPQWLVDAQTAGDVGPFQWILSASYTGQSIVLDKVRVLEHEVSGMLTFGLKF